MAPTNAFLPRPPKTNLQQHSLQSSFMPATPTSSKIDEEINTSKNVMDASKWRPALKNYVARCFESVEDSKKDEMERLLKVKLTHAFESDTEHSFNWDIEPLPGKNIIYDY